MSPFLYGVNLWDGNQAGKEADRVWGQVRAARLTLVRIGGIQYNDKTASPQTYARWIDSLRAAGAEPLVQVSAIESPSAAADLVSELNKARGYAVKYWSIGNEPTCGKAADAGTVAGIAANIKARASAMKAVDPTIRIFIGDECYWRPELYGPLVGGDQDVTGKDGAGRYYADGVAFHNYPFPGADQNAKYTRQQVLERGVSGIRSMLSTCKDQASKADTRNNRTGDAALECALTEFNVTYWNSSDNTLAGVGASSFLNGHFFAEVFGAAMEYGTFAVLPWSMMQSGGDGSGDDLGLFSDKDGAVVPRPAYHHLSLMSRNMRGSRLDAKSDAALVKAFATRDGDTAAILILNENQGAGGRVAIRLADAAPAGNAAYRVRVPIPMDGGAGGWDGEISDTLPPESTLLLKVLRGGKVAYRAVYSLDMALKGLAPAENRITVNVKPAEPTGGFPIFTAPQGGFLRGTLRYPGAYRVELRTPQGVLAVSATGFGTAMGAQWQLDLGVASSSLYLLTVFNGGHRSTRLIALP